MAAQTLTSFGAGFGIEATRQANASREAQESVIRWIENDCVVTVNRDTLTMEITTPSSPILPVVVIQGRIVDGGWQVSATPGPGQTVSAGTLAAAEAYAFRRVNANRVAREGAVN